MGLRGKTEGQRTRSPRGSRKRGLMAKGRMQERGTWGAPKNFGLLDGLISVWHTLRTRLREGSYRGDP